MQVVIDGILTNYEKVGSEKETLLILHGWQRSLNEWLAIAKKLSDQYSVFVIDLPGFGLTQRPQQTYTIYDYATFIEHFLDKVTIQKVTLMGHSFGGRIGIILGAKTNRIKTLILVDAAGVEKRTRQAETKITFFKLAKLFLPKVIIEKLRNKIGSVDYQSAGSMRDIFLKTINEDLTYLLPKVTTQTLLIWGEKDTEVPLWKTKLMKKLIPKSRLRVVWGAGHSPYLDKPKEFMEILKENLIKKSG